MALPYSITAEDVIASRIRSRLATLRNYRSTSIRSHGRLIESVRRYEEASLREVLELMEDHPDLPEVQRWGTKFKEVVEGIGEDSPEP
jgi:hypothetical protein